MKFTLITKEGITRWFHNSRENLTRVIFLLCLSLESIVGQSVGFGVLEGKSVNIFVFEHHYTSEYLVTLHRKAQ
jgi:hypothetical protein